VKFVIWYTAVLLLGVVAIEVAICPDQDPFVKGDLSGAAYVYDRDGAVAQSNAALRKQPPGARRSPSPQPNRPGA
jgi:hypothetical protein